MREMIHQVNTELGIAKYKISRCVNAGDFHKVLVDRRPEELQITECIPLCCKVDLRGFTMPLKIKITRAGNQEIKIFVSFNYQEPDQEKHD